MARLQVERLSKELVTERGERKALENKIKVSGHAQHLNLSYSVLIYYHHLLS